MRFDWPMFILAACLIAWGFLSFPEMKSPKEIRNRVLAVAAVIVALGLAMYYRL